MASVYRGSLVFTGTLDAEFYLYTAVSSLWDGVVSISGFPNLYEWLPRIFALFLSLYTAVLPWLIQFFTSLMLFASRIPVIGCDYLYR